MTWNVRFLEKNSLVYIKCMGHLDYNDFIKIAEEAAAISKQKNAKRFVLDNREADTQMSPAQIYEFPKLYENMEIKKGSRCCLLIKEDDKDRENVRFYETVCLNNGYTVKIFLDENKAIQWLCDE